MSIKINPKSGFNIPQPADPKPDIEPGSAQDFEQRYIKMATEEFNNNFIGLLRTRTTTIYISTNEEKRFIEYLYNVAAARGYEAFEWDCFRQLRKLRTNDKITPPAGFDFRYPEPILTYIIDELEKRQKKKEEGNGAIYILCDFYRWLSTGHCNPQIERQIKYINRLTTNSHVILTGPNYVANPALEKEISVLDFPFPNEQEIGSILWELVKSEKVQSGFPGITKHVQNHQEDIINSVKGLTTTEAIQAYSKSIVMSKQLGLKPFDINLILQEKKQIIKKTDILEYVDSHIDMNDVGGLDDLVHWLNVRKVAFLKEAESYGLKQPRGVLLLGKPGCGKSLTAKAVATLYGRPLLRLDFGKMFNSLVGESEKRAHYAIKLAETVAPCVAGDSIIYDSEGKSYKIEDLIGSNIFDTKVLYTYSLNEETWKLEKTEVRAVIKHPAKKKMLKITTPSGSIDVTLNHKMMTNRNGSLVWVEAQDLTKNDLLIMSKSFMRETKEMNIEDVIKNNKLSVRVGGKMHSVTVDKSKISIMQISTLAGFIDACGHLDPETGEILFFHKDVNIQNFVASIFSETFLTEPSVQNGTLRIVNKVVTNILQHFMNNIGSQPEDILILYLAGYFHVAGRMSFLDKSQPKPTKPVVFFKHNTSVAKERLLKVLHVFGIIGYSDKNAVILAEKSHIDALFLNIPFFSKSRAKSIQKFMKDAEHGDYFYNEMIGYKLSQSTAYMLQDLFKARVSGKNNSAAIKQDDDDVYIQHYYAEKLHLKAKIANVVDILSSFIESDIIGIRIEKIEEAGEQWAYDLSCEKNHNFFANGLLCHNCILWADEIEKGLSGGIGAGSGDSGTTKRVIGTFLTWLQEKESSVFVVCTANNVHDIPPEFMRAGRFDEVFFVDLPTLTGRKQIFEVLLRRFKFDPSKFDLDVLSSHTNGFSGAEIEKAIESAMFECFCDNKRPIETKDVLICCKSICPLSSTRAEEFEKMNEWAKGRCKFANTKDISNSISIPEKSNNLDI